MIENQESMTAKLCSFARAYHSIHDHSKIFDDYLAFDLMGKDEYQSIVKLIEGGLCDNGCVSCPYCEKINQAAHFLAPIPLARESFTQKIFNEFTRKHKKIQYVICGAGMDSFSFRNDNHNIVVFEVDHPSTQKYKMKRIVELGWIIQKNINFVPVDFSQDYLTDRLLESGFDPNLPSLFTILGVTYYLSLEAFETTVEQIDAISREGSGIILDYPDPSTFSPFASERVRRLTELTARLGEPMTRGFTQDEMESVFQRHHCGIVQHLSPNQIQKTYFGNRRDGLTAYENIHLMYAQKLEHYFSERSIFSI